MGETDLPSLYGSIDPYQDFVETFAIHVNTQLLGRLFRVDLYLEPGSHFPPHLASPWKLLPRPRASSR